MRIASDAESLATHHPYAFATFSILVLDILFVSNPSSSSRFIFLPPTLFSPRSLRKSHKQNWIVTL